MPSRSVWYAALIAAVALWVIPRGPKPLREATRRVAPVSSSAASGSSRSMSGEALESNRRGATRASLTRTANLSRDGTRQRGAPVETVAPPTPDGEARQPADPAVGAMTLENVEELGLTYHPSLAEYQCESRPLGANGCKWNSSQPHHWLLGSADRQPRVSPSKTGSSCRATS